MTDTPLPLPVVSSTTSIDGIKPKFSFSAHPTSPLSASAQASKGERQILRPVTPIFLGNNYSTSSLLSSGKSDASEERALPEDSPLMHVRERNVAQAPKPPL